MRWGRVMETDASESGEDVPSKSEGFPDGGGFRGDGGRVGSSQCPQLDPFSRSCSLVAVRAGLGLFDVWRFWLVWLVRTQGSGLSS